MNLLLENPLLTVFGGNSGNVGTGQQRRGLQRSHLNNESGNVGTQLCSINSHPPPLRSHSKRVGSNSHSETRIPERFCPRAHVPTHFAFSDMNKGVLARSA